MNTVAVRLRYQGTYVRGSLWTATLLAFAGLAIVLVGPIFDAHFAERLPVHDHIFLDGRYHSHTHIYDKQSAQPKQVQRTTPSSAKSANGLVMLPSNDGAATSEAGLVDSSAALAAVQTTETSLQTIQIPIEAPQAPLDPFLAVPYLPPRP